MFKLKYFVFFIVCFSATNIFAQKYVQISTEKQQESKDVIVYDSECHACIIDGVRLHQGKRFVFPHNNIQNFEKQLQRAHKITDQTNGGILVITEGVFGMSGDLGKLKEITDFFDIQCEERIGGENERLCNKADISKLTDFGWSPKIKLFEYLKSQKDLTL